jgi:hypothetical protein
MKYIIITLGCFSLISTLISITLLIKFLRLKSIIKHLSAAYSQIETIVSNNKNNISDNDVHQENFIKFLSESRDWAYGYIEEVQNGLKEFVNIVDPDLNHFDKFGEVGSVYPHYDSMLKINNAYKKLKQLLPAEIKE